MYTLTDVLPASGDRLLLCLTDEDGDAFSLKISSKAYSDFGLKKGEIDNETFDKLLDAAEFEKGLSKALDILSYGANSTKQLCEKLKRSGLPNSSISQIIRYLLSSGLLNLTEDAIRHCEIMLKKRYGKKRILYALRQKGYADEVLELAEEFLSDVDFVALCAEVIEIKFKELPKDEAEMKKAIAKLSNLGYNISEIKGAFQLLKNSENED